MTKKLLAAMFAVGFVLSVASQSMAALVTSRHNFGSTGGNWAVGPDGAEIQMCVACHTPHNANLSQVPLWNHDDSAAGFLAYNDPGGTMDAVAGVPTGISLACMSCHDDVTNVDAYGQFSPGTVLISDATINTTPGTIVGTDLTNDHPISFDYSTSLTDPEIWPLATATPLGGTIESDLLFGTVPNKTVECASCHDVHNGPEAVAAGSGYLLRVSMADSLLCLTCHNK